MERAKEVLDSDQNVFLLLGDSGADKSAFSLDSIVCCCTYSRDGKVDLD